MRDDRNPLRICMQPLWMRLLLAVGLLLTLSLAEAQMNCMVRTRALNFGTYNGGTLPPVDVTGRVRVRCNGMPFTPYTILMGPGGSGDATNRALFNATNQLLYNLFTDPARTIIWGDGTGGTGVVTGLPPPRNQRFDIYGRVFGSQNVPAGVYGDTIDVTVLF